VQLLRQTWRQPLWYLAIAAVGAGIYWRFKGLGTAPFAIDEYYLARSIENVLRSGIPAFKCGGLYMRGIVLQYSAAALQHGGFTAELAPRFISAICSLLAFPAVFILGGRRHGRIVGLLAVTIIALSVWEIEMARFGRMYAPFQAVFLWYLVFFLRYTVDRDRRALWPMIALSALGPLVWEGGVFLPLTNILSVFLPRWPDRLKREEWIYLVGCTALLVLAVWFVTADFRGYKADSWPPGYQRSLTAVAADPLAAFRLPVSALRQHAGWFALAIAPLLIACFALRWIWTLRTRPYLVVGLLAALLAAIAHQFLIVLAVGLLLLLTRLTTWNELFNRRAWSFHVAIGLLALFWVAFGIAATDWSALEFASHARRVAMLAYGLFQFPDFIGVVIRPWARAVPHLGAVLLLLVAIAMYRAARHDDVSTYERAFLTVFLVLVLAASASHPPRQETRYVFFLYPLALIIALGTISRFAATLTGEGAVTAGITSAIALGGFTLSEDFQPSHLAHIDEPAEVFRAGMSPDMQSHLVIRQDFRSLALWLGQHRSEHDLVINGVHGFDRYFPEIDYFFVEEQDPNFADWSCRRGTIERWGNYPLLYSVDGLATKLATTHAGYLVAFNYDRDALLASLVSLHPRIAESTGDVMIVALSQ